MMAIIRKVKLTGERSIQSKLQRLAFELEADANRIKADHPEQDSLSNGVRAISSTLGKMARGMDS